MTEANANSITVTDQLRQELETHMANRDRLLAEALRKYALISGTNIIGTYDTESDAINEGYRRLGNVPFLVKRITPVEEPANFLSPVVIF